jgi:hypothetical protein
MDAALLQRIVAATVAIFARSCEQSGFEQTPVGNEVSTTDACICQLRSPALSRLRHSIFRYGLRAEVGLRRPAIAQFRRDQT